eukprot:s264_g15.t1
MDSDVCYRWLQGRPAQFHAEFMWEIPPLQTVQRSLERGDTGETELKVGQGSPVGQVGSEIGPAGRTICPKELKALRGGTEPDPQSEDLKGPPEGVA